MSFGYDMDLNTSQQEANHDDSGIGLLDEGIDASFASKMQQSLKSHLAHGHPSTLPQGVS
jgi:regulatory factor X